MHLSLQEIAKLTGSIVSGQQDAIFSGVADLEQATPEDVSFYANPAYERAFKKSCAGAIFVSPTIPREEGKNYLLSDNPSLAFQKLLNLLHEERKHSYFSGVHETAVVHPSVKLGEGVTVGPYAVIEKESSIGAGSFVGAHVYIGPHCSLGKEVLLHPHAVLREGCRLGDKVILQPGAVLGGCGFGYTLSKEGEHVKLEQVGTVELQDKVEIGSNSTIDRARFKVTKIKRGTKIDNLVQIGHGAVIGEHNIIVAQVGIAGSSETGKYVTIGGQAAIIGHLKVGDYISLAGRTAVSKSLTQRGAYGGYPPEPIDVFHRNSVYLKNIAIYVKEIKELKERVEELEAKLKEVNR